MNPFQSLRDYEEYIYTLKQRFPSIDRSTLTVVTRGKRVAVLHGEMTFELGYRLSIQERLSFDTGNVVIEFYGYEFWRNNEKIAWYDAQPHPNDLTPVHIPITNIFPQTSNIIAFLHRGCVLPNPICLC